MELGATICTPRNPRCGACPVSDSCVARRKGLVERLPARRPRTRATEKHLHVIVAQRDGHCWAIRQPPDSVNGGLWEFPTVEVPPMQSRAHGNRDWEALGTFRHSITRFRIIARVFRTRGAPPFARRDGGRWLSPRELARLPFSALHRRIANRVAEL
jgi:A/G-specific adenine glycosylase